jgi:predicted MPP superfamily phosphohydrolase
MKFQISSFYIILALLIGYTAFKVTQIWPSRIYFTLPLTLAMFALMLSSTLIYRSNTTAFDKAWFHFFAWSGSFMMGLWAAFILFSIPIDLFRLLAFATHWISAGASYDFDGRDFFSQNFYLVVLAIATLSAAIGLIDVLRGAKVKAVNVPIENLPATLQGLKIAQISDLHIGMTIRKNYVEQVVQRTNATEPDLIIITGDLVDAKTESILEYLSLLSKLKSRYGVYFITGNHEYYWDAENLLEKLEEIGLQPLINANKVLQIANARILLAGITDPAGRYLAGHSPDIKKSINSQEETDLKILLAHRPNTYLEAEPLGFHLQFSGHTHAGQFFPFSLLIGLAHKYYRGLNRHGKLWVYVNPGTGYWGPTNRFAVASEISLISLIAEQ